MSLPDPHQRDAKKERKEKKGDDASAALFSCVCNARAAG
jgi:hypothetical protein